MKSITKFLPIVVLLLLVACQKDNNEAIDHDALEQQLYPKNEDGVTVLPAEGNARTIFRTAQIRPQGYQSSTYKATYYKKTGANTWTSLHPGINYLTGNVDIPLTWNYIYCRQDFRGLRIVPYGINNPPCMTVRIQVPGEWYSFCQDPVPNGSYIDTDDYNFVAGQNMEYKFKTDDGLCKDEYWIQEGAQCYNTSNPTCN